MSGFETDFITGRAINSEDRAVGIVIVPTMHGYPDPAEFPAQAPVYPNDRFEPLSMLLYGRLNDNGYFTPDEGQVSLAVFESLVGMPWKQFRKTVLNEHEAKITLGTSRFNQEEVAPGLAIMHATTAEALIAIAKTESDTTTDARTAAKITIDAKRRVAAGDDKYWTISEMGALSAKVYVTISGEEITVPKVSNALIDLEPYLLGHHAKNALHRHHRGAEETDGSKLVAIYENLADFQKLSYGLRMMRRYLEPSAHATGDNLVIVTKFNLNTVQASMVGFSDRNGFDEENERFDDQLEIIATSLRNTLQTVEAEIERRAAYRAGTLRR
ncbi:hypothetical protein [Rhizobium sp. MHM7A]|uniref:hypothetical protein n=1 Tax=Rhizobium sp. MHM7A TaxID=2583233 RepID=UPI0011061680|nr:hypothetical protein [Rhizobium sp. MHM7A]TLX16693.1 hypothetical protein FFR93_04950 [Rhizobium sp. MHM7A]